jgi:hypothetical protein
MRTGRLILNNKTGNLNVDFKGHPEAWLYYTDSIMCILHSSPDYLKTYMYEDI